MGEMADHYLEFIDCWPVRRFRRPALAKQIVTCKYCGGTGYYWSEINGTWRLTNPGGSLHECRPTAASAFEVFR